MQEGDPREHQGLHGVGALDRQMEGHPAAERVADDHDGQFHVAEHGIHRPGVLIGTPHLGRRRRGTEAGQVKGDGIERRAGGRCHDSIEVAV
jgi:hypothetical protein